MSSDIPSAPSPMHSIPEIKARIQEFNEDLLERAKSDEIIEVLLEARSDFIDLLLTECWHKILGEHSHKLSLIATGGYGRAELHPFSDIDLLIVFDEKTLDEYKSDLESFSTFLWDIGLKPGLSVRTIDDCFEQSKLDVTVITNLMEARLITGSEEFFDGMQEKVSAEKIWSPVEFFHEKVDEQHKRHLKFGNTAYNLEPDIKEGPGGLRDIQTIQWITQRYFGSNSLGELVNHAFLTKGEYRTLMKGQRFLWKVRFELHILANRPENRLLFDYQKSLALAFGFEDGNNNLAVEAFMQQYYRTVMELERINELILQIFNEALENKTMDVHPINEFFRVVNGYIEATHPDTFKTTPVALLDIFLQLQKHDDIKGVRAATIRLIRESLHLIDDEFRTQQTAQHLFLDIIRQPHGITHQFRRMNRYGVLAAYIPAFDDIIGRMQYDLFHAYTVDQHTLFIVRNLRRFALEKHKEDLPHCHEVFQSIAKPELLYLAGLFHDIAKGRGGNHAELGKEDAIAFCEQHGYNNYDTQLVGWVVQNHLIMSMTAQRKDINDPVIIHKFASKIGSLEYLDYLYLLTVADIRATNPTLWNDWKGSLLKELYHNTQKLLRRGLQTSTQEEDDIKDKQYQARQGLNKRGLNDEKIDAIWNHISKDYFSRFSIEDSIWHTLAISSCSEDELPLVLLRPQTKRGGAEIFIYVNDRHGMFAVCTATLDQLGLNILDARIIATHEDIALISFHVLEDTGSPIPDLSREQTVVNILRRNLLNPEQTVLSVDRHKTRQSKYFDTPTTIQFKEDHQKRFTILEINTHDQPGVLSIIGQCFSTCRVNVRNAKITTLGTVAEDIFYLTDSNNQMITDKALLDRLEALLIKELSPESETT
ncbi:MAG: bifunctional uridylyltransferase/uridylyl-removing protein [Cycloclasticus sp. symbiont of Bathymodiolus heckerae]|nr:MAG: bifunctional uridylyltransferase/uridylyl-removing protein [Cycloclasticus sp. symbiont of Bathymodiolus heckerae]